MARSSTNFKTNINENGNTHRQIYGNFYASTTNILNDRGLHDDNFVNEDDEDDNNIVKQDYDIDSIYVAERPIEDDLDAISDDNEDNSDMDNMEIDDELLVAAMKNSSTSNRTKSIEEHALSQKLSQLSTSVNNEQKKESNKKVPKKVEIDGLKQIPKYLMKSDKSFENMLTTVLVRNTATATLSPNKLDNYRAIAILIHRIKYIEILYSLWKVYLQSGLGQLKSHYTRNEPGPQLWVKPVQSMVKVTVRSGTEEHQACLAYVERRLDDLNKARLKSYADLQIQKICLPPNSIIIQQAIEKFIEDNLICLRKKIEYKIQLVQYDFDERILQLDYLKQNPTEAQIQLAEEFCTAKQQQELTKCTLELLEKQITHYMSSFNFDHLPIAHVPLFDSIRNIDIQQQFYAQYRQVIEETKTDMLTLYTQSASEQKKRYQNQYNDNKKEMRQDQRFLLYEQNLTMKMIELIEQCTHIIEERLKCIHHFKLQTLSIQS
ncbi:unnamed protein product [Rotaria sp. Silwood2]|nr:unnamed protein product [Rotaria sp. Silwood2]CAF3061120.1 unnamed protein product [Rotaria sp. Silwood2]CAF3400326.1 unnamed protein product [Rotaria sp. Silwood2]CAF4287747.1 unnamed protein product [Rotaria sp. Silwood2]CAF4389550.1 unnamed protein product [Rotaria sp. Silwood2]